MFSIEDINVGEICYRTGLGAAVCADSLEVLRNLPDSCVDLLLTSPPYALHFKKEYGNADQGQYVKWFSPFASEIHRVLKDDGSFVLNVGGSWVPGQPCRSIYQFELLLSLVKEHRFHLAQEFFWYNPAKLPAPAEWVTVQRIRVKDSVEYLWWFGKTTRPKASNRKVLVEYSPDMKRLLRKGYKAKRRPSGHNITSKFGDDNGGAIPGNLIELGNNDSNSHYLKRCAEEGIKPHPARFPIQLPSFFIQFLTDKGDLVVDPFAGSNTTGEAAETLGRRWVSIDREQEYVRASRFRFEAVPEEGFDPQLKLLDNSIPPVKTTRAMFK